MTRTQKIKSNSGVITLPILSDTEFDAVEGRSERRLDKCPTCHGKRLDGQQAGTIIASDNHHGLIEGQYRYRGETHECECRVQKALYRHYLAAGIGENYQRLDWNTDYTGDPNAWKIVNTYVEKWRSARQNGLGLTLWSKEQGTGKTFASTHIAKSLVKAGQRVQFVHFTDLISTVVYDSLEDERAYSYLPWLVIDEVWFNPARDSDAKKTLFGENFERLIRNRTNQNLPTIITSNFSPEQLREHWPRIFSLLEHKQMVIEVEGHDYRVSKNVTEGIEMFLNDETRPIT